VTDSSSAVEISVTGASGSISGGTFNVTGRWDIRYNFESSDIATGSNQSAQGSFYGPSAENVGGVWRVRGDRSGVTAIGVFEGSKQ